MNNRFKDQCAVVTGGASGLGFGIAQRLASEGARVCIWDVNPGTLANALEQISESRGIAVDIVDPKAVEAAAEETVRKIGGIQILVASAGISGPNLRMWEYSIDDWNRVMNINLNGMFHCCRSVVPRMLAGSYGRIVNISSIAGKEGNPNASAYSASKAGVIALTKSLGKELAETNIRV